MEDLLQWGLDLIVTLQRIRTPGLDGSFQAITLMGQAEFYLFLLPLVFWCVDFRLGARLAVLFLLSSYLNLGLKDLFQQPRPFDLDPSVQLSSAEGYGVPSGHAQAAVVVWGSLAAWAGKGWFWAVGIGMMALIGLSRLYLGVHFPTDVLVGWGIGSLLLGLYLAVHSKVERRLASLSLSMQVVLALAVPSVLLLIHPVEDTISAMAALSGMGVGLALMYRYLSFSASGPWWQRAARFLIGAVAVLALYLGLGMAFPGQGSALHPLFRSLRYGLIGMWITLGAPWLFRLLRLAPGAKEGA